MTEDLNLLVQAVFTGVQGARPSLADATGTCSEMQSGAPAAQFLPIRGPFLADFVRSDPPWRTRCHGFARIRSRIVGQGRRAKPTPAETSMTVSAITAPDRMSWRLDQLACPCVHVPPLSGAAPGLAVLLHGLLHGLAPVRVHVPPLSGAAPGGGSSGTCMSGMDELSASCTSVVVAAVAAVALPACSSTAIRCSSMALAASTCSTKFQGVHIILRAVDEHQQHAH